MYNLRIGRIAALAVAFTVLVVGACSTFGEDPAPSAEDAGADRREPANDGAPAPDAAPPGDGGGADADAGKPDGDAGIIEGETAPTGAVSCDAQTCALGEGCCFGEMGPTCKPRAACTGFFFACVATVNCGSASTCCFDGTRSACAEKCGGGGGLCGVGSDCAPSTCGPVKCGVDGGLLITPFSLCSDTTVLPATRDQTTCTR